jgi:endonuclease/exonuclease/phosphatase family metal-dependent hydrolase
LEKHAPFELSIAQWNCRSVNKIEKINFIRGLRSNLTALQEIWKKGERISEMFQHLNIVERTTKRGGGTATLLNNFPDHKITEIHSINKDTNLIKVIINNNYLWIANVYLSKGKISKLQKLFGKLQNFVPLGEMSQVLLIGDFNVDIRNTKSDSYHLLIKLCKQLGLKIEVPETPTRNNTTLDFLICGRSIKTHRRESVPSPSDHLAIRWDITIDFPNKTKQLKIPSKETAERITEKLLGNEEVTGAAIFLDELREYRLQERKHLQKLVKHKPRDLHLFEKLLQIDNPAQVNELVSSHWQNIMQRIERTRWTNESKLAYKDLKDILKYHLYEKRDGGIIALVLSEDGTIISELEKVYELLAKTIEEIQVDERWKFLDREEFPMLPMLSQKEVKHFMKEISTNKAITLDGLSDILFDKENRKISSYIFRDLWSISLDKIRGIQKSFTSRLLPLNKVFPNIPTRKQMRPILICSPLQKLLEARFLPKLRDYLCRRLTPCQTGFISKMGIQVNLYRAIQRIKNKTENGGNTYGLFIDFANAYNTVPHELLFQKLRRCKCLDNSEIDYLEALYTHYRIQIGKKMIKYNKGVAQGSLLSPALFNIFIEDLVESIATELKISIEDILLYADDILILCQSQEQIIKCIQIIERWSYTNGMELNKNKSGILVFAPRRAKKIPLMKLEVEKDIDGNVIESKWTTTVTNICGVPIVTKYKYLGTYIDSKLTMNFQFECIERKSNFLYTRLYPYLSHATADARKDMWRTMVLPLFNALLILLHFEEAKTNSWRVLRLLIGTFKKFLMIPRNTSTSLVSEMIGIDIPELVARNVVNSEEKWEARKERRQPDLIPKPETPNYLRGIPNEWCQILKQQFSRCQICKNNIQNEDHISAVHNVSIYGCNEIWAGIKKYHDKTVEIQKKKKGSIEKVKRTKYLEYWGPRLKAMIEDTAYKINLIYTRQQM